MADEKPAPRQRTRSTPPAPRAPEPAPAPVPAPSRLRQRATPPRQVEATDAPLPAFHASADKQPRRAGAIGMDWHEVAGTEFDLFTTRATSPYSYGGIAIGSPGGGEIRGFYYKHADKGRFAIYIIDARGDMEFVKWMAGSSVDAMQAVSAAWLARKGLRKSAA